MSQTLVRTPQAETTTSLLPGLRVVACGVVLAVVVNRIVPSVSALMVALLLGALLTNLGLAAPATRPGFAFATKPLLRAGVVLLGLQLALPQVLALGRSVLTVVFVSVVVTFFGTQWMGRRLGLSRERSLLVATGFSICGASAVAAMNGVADGEEEDVMSAVALVTIYGSLAVVALPLLQRQLGLDATAFGIWSGASVHEVAQVVAAASTAGSTALTAAVVVKLTRVVLLAPLIAAVSLWRRHTVPCSRDGKRPPLVPLFVIGFLVAMSLRSVGAVPAPLLEQAKLAQTLLLGAGMFGMGASVRLRPLLRTGGPGLALGLLSTLLIAAVSYAGIALVS
jgi:uncharacterized integral membrane protein (TIGR00698 family)